MALSDLELQDIPDALLLDLFDHLDDYAAQHEGKIHVIKASGKIIGKKPLRERFAKQVVAMRRMGLKVVVLHGAGKQIDAAIKEETGKTSRFENGLRVTEAEHVEIIDRVTQETNKLLCDTFDDVSKGRIIPFGMAGHERDVDIVSSPIDAQAGNFSGENVISINKHRLVSHLEDPKRIPIITNMARINKPVKGVQKINLNADSVANAMATTLKAYRLMLCSDVPGVLEPVQPVESYTSEQVPGLIKNGILRIVPEIHEGNVRDLIERKIISGGMLVKVEQAFKTAAEMSRGGAVVIMDENFLMELLTKKGHGTMIRPIIHGT